MHRLILTCGVLGGILFEIGLYLIFMVVPSERIMGAVQRIFYVHVPAAIAAYLAFGIVLIGSCGFLATRERKYDTVNYAASLVAFFLCTMNLGTGMIWGHSAWNTWFRWEPRLVTFLLLWCISLSLVTVRVFGGHRQTSSHCSVLGIIGALTTPLVWISVKFLPETAQLHPVVIERGGLKHPMYFVTLLTCFVSLCLLTLFFVYLYSYVRSLYERYEACMPQEFFE
jgi:heme exporter protein C